MNTPQPERLRAALKACQTSPATANEGKSYTTCISLFPTDTAIIEAISGALAKQGQRITNSQAIRLALRAVEINNPRLLQILEEMKAADGRKNRPLKGEKTAKK